MNDIASSVYHVVLLLAATIKDFVMSKCIVNEIHIGEELKMRKRIILREDLFQNLGILEAMLLKPRL